MRRATTLLGKTHSHSQVGGVSTVWVPRMHLRLLGLAVNALTYWAIRMLQKYYFLIKSFSCKNETCTRSTTKQTHPVMVFSSTVNSSSDPEFHCTAHVSSGLVLSFLLTLVPAPWIRPPNAGETITISKRCLCSRLIPTSPLRKPIQFPHTHTHTHISGSSFHDLTLKKNPKFNIVEAISQKIKTPPW